VAAKVSVFDASVAKAKIIANTNTAIVVTRMVLRLAVSTAIISIGTTRDIPATNAIIKRASLSTNGWIVCGILPSA
jgi:hypothetical protein